MARWLGPLICMLACPLLMVGLMGGMGRDRESKRLDRETRRLARSAGTDAATEGSTVVASASWVRRLWCAACLNWKVIAGLAGVAGLVALVSPHAFVVVGPVLLVLVCPLSMLVAMAAMRRRRSPERGSTRAAPAPHSSVGGGTSAAADETTGHRLPVECGPIRSD